ncbi:hypothetical protein GPJ56_003404 [Histomonas meleagridis]|uniref:uncharacterized protein n=1 Tax=Histomonas meleagridis TaxID=135588 RepID=UPI00355ABFEE|nr:hypothetical protein GPJ56_003404 [Histomonas meleagridis]KAH0805023.1 hypothetical protein GO595_001968 [Histomonas meleagridis]
MEERPNLASTDEVSLELFLDPNSYCIRTIANDDFPLFEFENKYDMESDTLLKSIEGHSIDGRLIEMFSGIDEKRLESGVQCHISDRRTDIPSERDLWLVKRTSSSNSFSSEESEPNVSYSDSEFNN